MSMGTVVLFIVGIMMGSVGALCMKVGALKLPDFSPTPGYAVAFVSSPYIMSGFFLYFVPAVIWTYLLAKLPVSIVQPILALTYVVTPVLALMFLGEPVPVLRWLGIAVIIIGVVIVAGT